MSSSSTETLRRRHDAPDGRVGGRGHGRRVEEAGRRLGRGRRDHRLDLDRQDRHRRRVPGDRPRGRDHRRRRRHRRRRHRDGADRHRRQAGRGARRPRTDGSRGRTGEAAAALEAPGEAGELSATRPRAASAQRPRAPARRYSPVVMRIAAEHDVDLEQVEGTGRGGRVSKKDVLAFVESGPKEEPPMHIECPYRPDEPVAPKARKPRLQRVEEVPRERPRRPRLRLRPPPGRRRQPLSRMRQAIGSRMVQSLQTAATCTTIAEADMTRIEAARKAAEPQLPALPGAGDGRDAARVPAAQRHARGRHPHGPHRRRAPRHRGLARRGRPDRPDHPRRAGPERRGPGQAHQGHRASAPARTSSRRTR